jgi:hypothetical protein
MFARKRSDRLKCIARTALAAILLAGLLGGVLPLETLASGQMCTLACCAGRAPHAAGSCMDGSCHAALKKHSSHLQSSHRKQITEQLCGAARFARRLSSRESIKSAAHSAKEDESQHAQLSSATITKPCLPDCGSCGSGFASADFRKHAVITPRERPRRPVGPIQGRASFGHLLTLKTLIRHTVPRAPPITLS